MNYTDVDLQQVRLDFPYAEERIFYGEKDLIINIPEEVQFTIQKLYRSVERIAVDEIGNFYVEEALEETDQLMATARVSGPFYYFLLELYKHLEKQLQEYDRWEGNSFNTPLQHLLGKSKQGRDLLYLRVKSTDQRPVAFCVHSLDLSLPKARCVIQTKY